MSKFFGFYNEKEHCYTTINIDKIIVVNEIPSTIRDTDDNWFKSIIQAQIFIEVGKDAKEYILDEYQYQRLNLMLRNKNYGKLSN